MEDTPIDAVAAVHSLQLSIADFVFPGLHLLIPDNNRLLDVTSKGATRGEEEEEEDEEEETLLTGRPCCQEISLWYELDSGERAGQTSARRGGLQTPTPPSSQLINK